MKVSDQENFLVSAKINLTANKENSKNPKSPFSFKTSFSETVSSFILIKNDKKSYNNSLVSHNELAHTSQNENSVYTNTESSASNMTNNVYTSVSNGITNEDLTRHYTLKKKRPKRIFRQGKSHFKSQYQASTISTQGDAPKNESKPTINTSVDVNGNLQTKPSTKDRTLESVKKNLSTFPDFSNTISTTKHKNEDEIGRIDLFKSKDTIATQINYEPLLMESDSSATNSMDLNKDSRRYKQHVQKPHLMDLLNTLPAKSDTQVLTPITKHSGTPTEPSSHDNSLKYLRDKIAQKIEYNLDKRSQTLTDEHIRTGESGKIGFKREPTSRRDTTPDMTIVPSSNKNKSGGKPPLNNKIPITLQTFEDQGSNRLPTTVTFHQETTDRHLKPFTRRRDSFSKNNSNSNNKSLEIEENIPEILPDFQIQSTKNTPIHERSSENLSPNPGRGTRKHILLGNSSKGSTTITKRSKSKQDSRVESRQESKNFLTFYLSKDKSFDSTPHTPGDRSPVNNNNNNEMSQINESKSQVSVSPADNNNAESEQRSRSRGTYHKRTYTPIKKNELMERIEQAVEPPKSGIKDLLPSEQSRFDPMDLLKSTRFYEETMRTTKTNTFNAGGDHMAELEKLVYSNQAFEKNLQNFEDEYYKFMDDYAKKIKLQNVKKFNEELKIYLNEKNPGFESITGNSVSSLLPTLSHFTNAWARNSSLPVNNLIPVQGSSVSTLSSIGHRPRPPTRDQRAMSVGRNNTYYKG